MLRIIPKRSRERDSHTARVQKIPMRPFTSPIHKPMLFQIRDELPNLARHIKLPSKKQLQSNAKFPKFAAAIVRSRASADEKKHRLHEYHGYNFAIGHSRFVILRLSAKSAVFRAVLIDRKRDITDRTSSSNFRKHWCTLVLAEP